MRPNGSVTAVSRSSVSYENESRAPSGPVRAAGRSKCVTSRRVAWPRASTCSTRLPSPSYAHRSVAPCREPTLDRPLQTDCRTQRVGERHHPAETITFRPGDGAGRIGDGDRETGGVGPQPAGVPERVRDGQEVAVVAVCGGRDGARRVGHGRRVAALVVVPAPARAVRLRQRDRQPRSVAFDGQHTPVGARDRGDVARLVVRPAGGPAERVGLGQLPVVPVPLMEGRAAEWVDHPLHL